MAPLSLETLVPGEPTPADLFLPLFNAKTHCVEMTPACSKGEEFRSLWRNRLLESN